MPSNDNPVVQRLLQRTQLLRDRIEATHDKLAETEVAGHAGGVVTITVRGTGEVTSIKIDPTALDPRNVEWLEQHLMSAFRDAHVAARALLQDMSAHLGDLGSPADGVDH